MANIVWERNFEITLLTGSLKHFLISKQIFKISFMFLFSCGFWLFSWIRSLILQRPRQHLHGNIQKFLFEGAKPLSYIPEFSKLKKKKSWKTMYDFWFDCLKKCITVSKIIKICLTHGMVFVPLLFTSIRPRNQTYTVVSAPAVWQAQFSWKSQITVGTVCTTVKRFHDNWSFKLGGAEF